MFKLKKAATAAEHMCVFDELQQIVSTHIFYVLHLGSNWIRPQPSLKISTISLGNFQNRERVATETTTNWTIGQSGQLEKKIGSQNSISNRANSCGQFRKYKMFFLSLPNWLYRSVCAAHTRKIKSEKNESLIISFFFWLNFFRCFWEWYEKVDRSPWNLRRPLFLSPLSHTTL